MYSSPDDSGHNSNQQSSSEGLRSNQPSMVPKTVIRVQPYDWNSFANSVDILKSPSTAMVRGRSGSSSYSQMRQERFNSGPLPTRANQQNKAHGQLQQVSSAEEASASTGTLRNEVRVDEHHEAGLYSKNSEEDGLEQLPEVAVGIRRRGRVTNDTWKDKFPGKISNLRRIVERLTGRGATSAFNYLSDNGSEEIALDLLSGDSEREQAALTKLYLKEKPKGKRGELLGIHADRVTEDYRKFHGLTRQQAILRLNAKLNPHLAELLINPETFREGALSIQSGRWPGSKEELAAGRASTSVTASNPAHNVYDVQYQTLSSIFDQGRPRLNNLLHQAEHQTNNDIARSDYGSPS